jgi:bifunctional DNA-binding transcriptional regulator/antitoxin component of YhaV-PrlF toxin-antitoxin module
MELTLDTEGRIQLPEVLRQQLGLTTTSVLNVVITAQGLLLTEKRGEPVVQEGTLLLTNGDIEEEQSDLLQYLRQERLAKFQ